VPIEFFPASKPS